MKDKQIVSFNDAYSLLIDNDKTIIHQEKTISHSRNRHIRFNLVIGVANYIYVNCYGYFIMAFRPMIKYSSNTLHNGLNHLFIQHEDNDYPSFILPIISIEGSSVLKHLTKNEINIINNLFPFLQIIQDTVGKNNTEQGPIIKLTPFAPKHSIISNTYSNKPINSLNWMERMARKYMSYNNTGLDIFTKGKKINNDQTIHIYQTGDVAITKNQSEDVAMVEKTASKCILPYSYYLTYKERVDKIKESLMKAML
jgi:hypothetical protein